MDLKQILNRPCHDFEVRESRRIDGPIFEWQYAEDAAFSHFKKYFETVHRGGLVFNQDSFRRVGSEDRQIRFVLKALSIYLRNWWSKKNPTREGRARKPDGVGISPGGRVIEVIEVKPAKLAIEADIQLHEVIDKIQDGLVAYYKEKSIERGISLPFDPTSIVVRGSPWRPRDDELIVMPKAAAWVKENAWICFGPTVRSSASGVFPHDGVILYEIHVPRPASAQKKIRM